MNFSPKTTAWIKLIALVFSTGITVAAAAYTSGAKPIYCVVIGIGVAATNVYHALSPSPNDQPTKSPM